MTHIFTNLVAGAVESGDGRMFAQLVHPGRISHPALLDGHTPVAPSAVRPVGRIAIPGGPVEFVAPRPLETEEVTAIVSAYSRAAKLAVAAGLGGVEIHAGDGYLPHQFLATNTNLRIDKWGGSVTNRVRFLLETAEAAAAVIGADRVAVRISPERTLNDIKERDAEVIYAFLAHRLSALGLAYLRVVDCKPGFDLPGLIRANYRGPWRIEECGGSGAEARLDFAQAA
jgi:N-ethylmaleimide reductase